MPKEQGFLDKVDDGVVSPFVADVPNGVVKPPGRTNSGASEGAGYDAWERQKSQDWRKGSNTNTSGE